jgi:hypothetical protein
MQIVGLHSKGYAPATNGGVIYNLKLHAPKRFPSIEKKGNIPVIAVTIMNSGQFVIEVISQIISTGRLSGETEALTKAETTMIYDWIMNHKLTEDAKAIVAEDKRITKEMDKLYKKHHRLCNKPHTNYEELVKRSDVIDALSTEIDRLFKQRDGLKNIPITNEGE